MSEDDISSSSLSTTSCKRPADISIDSSDDYWETCNSGAANFDAAGGEVSYMGPFNLLQDDVLLQQVFQHIPETIATLPLTNDSPEYTDDNTRRERPISTPWLLVHRSSVSTRRQVRTRVSGSQVRHRRYYPVLSTTRASLERSQTTSGATSGTRIASLGKYALSKTRSGGLS